MPLTSNAVKAIILQELASAELASWVANSSLFFGDSNQDVEEYGWFGQVPAMREWVSGRHAQQLAANGIKIENKTFEATIELSAKWLRRANAEAVRQAVAQLPAKGVSHWSQLLGQLLLNGAAATCYDGQYFFDTDHASGSSGAQSNKLTSTAAVAAAPTTAEMNKAIFAAIQAILGFVGDKGEPANEDANRFTVLVPPIYMESAGTALGATVVGNNSNALQAVGALSGFSVDLAVTPRLRSWSDKFAVIRTDGGAKPFIRQQDGEVRVSAKAEGSEYEFDTGNHMYGISADRNVGYGFWQSAVLMTLAP